MQWELLQPSQLQELVNYEADIFDKVDCSSAQEYLDHINSNGLQIHVLRNPTNIVGCFQILPRDDAVYMCGFSVHLKFRGKGISKIVMKELLSNYLDRGIVCKTLANHPIMRKLLRTHGWVNNTDKFEKGTLWSWWFVNNDTVALASGLKRKT